MFGDDIEHRAAFFLIDTTNPAEVLAFYRAYVGAGRSPEVRATMIEAVIANAGSRARDSFAAMCEVAQRFAGWLDLGSSIQAALEYVFARWDGRGFPDARGDAIPLPMRLLHVARDISLFLSAAGPDEARDVIERRAGAAYEPRLAELAVRNFGDLLADLDEIADVGAGDRDRAVPADPDRGRHGSMPPSRRSPHSPVSSRRGCASTRRAWRSSPRPPPGEWVSRQRP